MRQDQGHKVIEAQDIQKCLIQGIWTGNINNAHFIRKLLAKLKFADRRTDNGRTGLIQYASIISLLGI